MTYVTEDLTENLGAEIRFITGDRVENSPFRLQGRHAPRLVVLGAAELEGDHDF